MKKSAFVFIALIVLLGCIFCAGCTTTPAEKYYEQILSEFDESSDMSQYYSSSGSFTLNGYTVSYESSMEDSVRTMKVMIDDKKYTLTANPAQDAICGDWTGDNELTVTFEIDGLGYYNYPESEYTHTFFWGKEADGSYKFVFADNSIRTAQLSQNVLTDSEGLVLKK